MVLREQSFPTKYGFAHDAHLPRSPSGDLAARPRTPPPGFTPDGSPHRPDRADRRFVRDPAQPHRPAPTAPGQISVQVHSGSPPLRGQAFDVQPARPAPPRPPSGNLALAQELRTRMKANEDLRI